MRRHYEETLAEIRADMPVYDYFCEANHRTVEVTHPLGTDLRIWGEVCYAAQIPLGDTDPLAPVRRVITRAPGAVVATFNAELRNAGFTKLVRRDEGVFENVTATGDEARYVRDGEPGTLPHLDKKVED
jgi:hypothetical protein